MNYCVHLYTFFELPVKREPDPSKLIDGNLDISARHVTKCLEDDLKKINAKAIFDPVLHLFITGGGYHLADIERFVFRCREWGNLLAEIWLGLQANMIEVENNEMRIYRGQWEPIAIYQGAYKEKH